MSVLAIRRATQQVLHRLPSDLTPMIRGWIGGTRSDWRTCKQQEARIIEDYNEGIRIFVQELMERRVSRVVERERVERERSRPLTSPLSYHVYRFFMYWYGVYQFMVMVYSHARGN